MSAFAFKPATKKQSRLRMALMGPSGSGKTYSALAIAAGMGARVAVVDSERGSASKYADKFKFDVLELTDFDPANYIKAIAAADAAGYDAIVIDSLSHAWMGKGGALEKVDQAQKRSNSGNSFAAWRDVTPLHNALVDAMLQSRAHLIVTMRSKTEYVMEENDRGKKVPRKVGMAPVQRDGLEYEFDVVGEMTLDNDLSITKTRCDALNGKWINKPGAALAKTLLGWLTDGVLPPAEAAFAPAVAAVREAFPGAIVTHPIPEDEAARIKAKELDAETLSEDVALLRSAVEDLAGGGDEHKEARRAVYLEFGCSSRANAKNPLDKYMTMSHADRQSIVRMIDNKIEIKRNGMKLPEWMGDRQPGQEG